MLRDLINFLRKKPSHEVVAVQASWSVAAASQDAEALTVRYLVNAPEQLGTNRFPHSYCHNVGDRFTDSCSSRADERTRRHSYRGS